jgi:RecB family exonuclease
MKRVHFLPVKPLEFKPYERERLPMTAVEDYYVCPLLFYFRHVERVEPPFVSPDGPSPKLKGTLLHALVERLVGEVSDWRDERLIREIGMSIALEGGIFDMLSLSLTKFELELLARDMADFAVKFAKVERVYRDLFGAKPEVLESRVSLDEWDVEVVGRMDRKDRCRWGTVIFDYKTGKRKRSPEVKKGNFGSLQLFLYALADGRPLPVGVGIYPLKQLASPTELVPQIFMLTDSVQPAYHKRFQELVRGGDYGLEEMKVLYRFRDNKLGRKDFVREAYAFLSEAERRNLELSVRWSDEFGTLLANKARRICETVVSRVREGDYLTFFAPDPEKRMLCEGKFHKGYHFCPYSEVCRENAELIRRALAEKVVQL